MRKTTRTARRSVIQKCCKQINMIKKKIAKHEESAGGENVKRFVFVSCLISSSKIYIIENFGFNFAEW